MKSIELLLEIAYDYLEEANAAIKVHAQQQGDVVVA